MNNKYFYILITIFLVIIFYLKTEITNNTLFLFNKTKNTIQHYILDIQNSISTHFNQAKQIQTLKKENQEYKNYLMNSNILIQKCQSLQNFKQLKTKQVTFTQTISYANLPDMTSIYIDYSDKNITTPKGLVFNNQTAGIVIKNIKNFSLAYLNNNTKTSYTVFIGKNKIPGILFGGEKIIIKYIPKYHKINIGDLVITSGLDKIFYEGVNVGKISSITQKTLYQEAIIKPFYNTLHPTFFYVVRN